jgi:hypothetical protein
MPSFAKPPARQQQSPNQAKPQTQTMPQSQAMPQAKSPTQAKPPMPEQAAENRRTADDEVRPLAYQKWQEAGCPACDGVEFWLAAEIEILRRQKPR